MTRTCLKDRVLPTYSKGEEIFNMTSHIVGAAFGLIALIVCVIIAAFHQDVWAVVSSCIYGVSLIALYTMSSIYHGLPKGMPKKVMQVMDHCTIYFLIAGTYTPVTLTRMREMFPATAWIVVGAVWLLAVIATVFTAIDLRKFRTFSMICYLGMGWCIVFSASAFIQSVGLACAGYILLGGIFYTIGAILYGIGKGKHAYWHCVFHVFVLLGTFFQFWGIVNYII